MKAKPICPEVHGLTDYALVGSLLLFPRLFGFPKNKNGVKAEALLLLGYVALTRRHLRKKVQSAQETVAFMHRYD